MRHGGQPYELGLHDALTIYKDGIWHKKLLAAFSEFGFCQEPGDIPIQPLLLEKSFLSSSSAELRRLIDLARQLSAECNFEHTPVRADKKEILDAFRASSRQVAIARPDCILSNGTLKVLELNIGSGLGGIQEVDTLAQAYERSELYKTVNCRIRSPLQSQVELIGQQLEGIERKQVCIVPLADHNRFYLDQSDRLAAEVSRHLGILAKTVFPEALHTGSWLTDGQHEYGLFYQFACFHHEPILLAGMQKALLRAQKTHTKVLGDPLDVGVDDKGGLALVSEYLDGVGAQDPTLSALRPMVPWTRLMDRKRTIAFGAEVDLEEFVLANKAHLVLKRCASHAGKQVYVGRLTDPAIWVDLVSRANTASRQAESWVVQELVESEQVPLWFASERGELRMRHCSATVGPYLFGDREEGWLVRIQCADTPEPSVLALPTDGNMGITTVAAVSESGVPT